MVSLNVYLFQKNYMHAYIFDAKLVLSSIYMHEPAREVLVHVGYARMPIINAHVDVSREATCIGLKFGMSCYLYPSFMYASSEGSDESAHMHSLT